MAGLQGMEPKIHIPNQCAIQKHNTRKSKEGVAQKVAQFIESLLYCLTAQYIGEGPSEPPQVVHDLCEQDTLNTATHEKI